MCDKNFKKALEMIFTTEGGYSNIGGDYGGPTNLGITQTTFNRWRKMNNKNIENIRNITKKEAEKIYYEMHWKASGADKQKNLKDSYILFDTAVQYGDVAAKRMFKNAGENFYNMLNLRKAKYLETVKNNPSQDIFLQGWLNRINNLEKQAEQFAKEERQASEYKERVLPLSSQTQINNKINKNDIISNKIYYYMQKNQDELNKHNPYITDINGDLRKKVYF